MIPENITKWRVKFPDLKQERKTKEKSDNTLNDAKSNVDNIRKIHEGLNK